MRLRRATVEDIPLLRDWEQQPHVVAATGAVDGDDFWDWDGELPKDATWRELLIAQVEDRPVGFIQIIDPLLEETRYWGDCAPNLRAIDIWTGRKEDLGRGFGGEMMRLATRRCFDDPDVAAILIDPLERNIRAHRFYKRLGFEFMETRRFGEDNCFVFQLTRKRWSQFQ
ncbi:GNAT family N-acetyltransferase [Hyphococcus sp.]|uniref:GNAT family N-acetyltransferase n=1 Tax=Hyphococcus sp. TaxID=2038636 RepID=UPI003CCBFB96